MPFTQALIFRIGEGVTAVPGDATVFPDSDADYLSHPISRWPDAANDEQRVAANRAFVATMRPLGTGHAHLNFRPEADPTWDVGPRRRCLLRQRKRAVRRCAAGRNRVPWLPGGGQLVGTTNDASRRSSVGCMRFLSDDDKGAVYGAALEILAHIGMVVHHSEALRLLADAGCRIEPDRVYVPERVVERARESAPPIVRMHDRGGELVMELGRHNSYFGTGSDLMWTCDLKTGERRRSTLDDAARAARLVDALPNMDFAMSSAYPNEVEPHHCIGH